MSLSSWPPTGFKPAEPEQKNMSSLLAKETKEQVFEEMLQEMTKFLPGVYSIRQNTILKWRSRYKKAS